MVQHSVVLAVLGAVLRGSVAAGEVGGGRRGLGGRERDPACGGGVVGASGDGGGRGAGLGQRRQQAARVDVPGDAAVVAVVLHPLVLVELLQQRVVAVHVGVVADDSLVDVVVLHDARRVPGEPGDVQHREDPVVGGLVRGRAVRDAERRAADVWLDALPCRAAGRHVGSPERPLLRRVLDLAQAQGQGRLPHRHALVFRLCGRLQHRLPLALSPPRALPQAGDVRAPALGRRVVRHSLQLHDLLLGRLPLGTRHAPHVPLDRHRRLVSHHPARPDLRRALQVQAQLAHLLLRSLFGVLLLLLDQQERAGRLHALRQPRPRPRQRRLMR